MSNMISFALGYILGGGTALVVLGLTVAARRGDSGHSEPSRARSSEENLPAWREHV